MKRYLVVERKRESVYSVSIYKLTNAEPLFIGSVEVSTKDYIWARSVGMDILREKKILPSYPAVFVSADKDNQ